MRNTVAAAMLPALILSGCTWPATPPRNTAPPPTASTTRRLVSVADGDTFTAADTDGERTKVRLLGIDAPEAGHNDTPANCGATQSTNALRDLLAGADLTVTSDPVSDETDRFGRRLAYVTADGHDVALTLITAGMAAAWYPASEPQPTRYPTYRNAERSARASRAGLWAICDTIGR